MSSNDSSESLPDYELNEESSGPYCILCIGFLTLYMTVQMCLLTSVKKSPFSSQDLETIHQIRLVIS